MDKEQNTPHYIKQLPWYAQDSQGGGQLIKLPTYQPKGYVGQWYNRAQKGFQATSYRKGACQNCGAMGHTKKDCTERPRKIGAKFSNQHIASDDVLKEVGDSWQIKKDRWNGYTPDMYQQVIEDFNKFDEVRKKIKPDETEGSRKDDNPIVAAKLSTKNLLQKFQGLNTGRNREDRAKYLNNLDVNSAEFDPKSRTLAGEDAILKQLTNLESSEKAALEEQDNFAFEQVEKHHMELNSTALPTLTEKIHTSIKSKKEGLVSGRIGEIMKRYNINRQEFIPEVEEDEQEAIAAYLKGNKIVRSRYEQDVFVNDHLAVWGSWYNKYLGWGYACCHSTDKLSYCSGLKGREKALARQFKLKAQEAAQLQNSKLLEGEAQKEEKSDVPQDKKADE